MSPSFLAYPLGLLNPAQVYLTAPYLWDAIIYFMLFLGLATFVYTQKGTYGKKRGKPVAIAIAMALTFSLSVWEYTSGWYLGQTRFAILPLIILLGLFFLLFYRMLTQMFNMKAHCAAAISYYLTYAGAGGMFDGAISSGLSQYPSIGMVLDILILTAFITLIVCVIGLFPKSTPTGTGDDGGGTSSGAGTMPDGGRGGNEPGGLSPGKPGKGGLEVKLKEPKNKAKISVDDKLPVKAKISGGTGNYVWRVITQKDGGDAEEQKRGKGENVKVSVGPFPPGKYRVYVIVQDGQSEANANARFRVEYKDSQLGVIEGTGVYATTDEPVQDRTIFYLVDEYFDQLTGKDGKPIRTTGRVDDDECTFVFKDIPIPKEGINVWVQGYTPSGENGRSESAVNLRRDDRKKSVRVRFGVSPNRVLPQFEQPRENAELLAGETSDVKLYFHGPAGATAMYSISLVDRNSHEVVNVVQNASVRILGTAVERRHAMTHPKAPGAYTLTLTYVQGERRGSIKREVRVVGSTEGTLRVSVKPEQEQYETLDVVKFQLHVDGLQGVKREWRAIRGENNKKITDWIALEGDTGTFDGTLRLRHGLNLTGKQRIRILVRDGYSVGSDEFTVEILSSEPQRAVTISGHVTDSGAPSEGRYVQVLDERGAELKRSDETRITPNNPDLSGAYSLQLGTIPDGPLIIQVVGAPQTARPLQIAEGANEIHEDFDLSGNTTPTPDSNVTVFRGLVLHVEPNGRIVGPAAGGAVRLSFDGTLIAQTRIADNGSYAVRDTHPKTGVYVLDADTARGHKTLRIRINRPGRVSENLLVPVDANTGQQFIVEGKAVYDDGRGITEVLPRNSTAQLIKDGRQRGIQGVGPDGSFRVADDSPVRGDYLLVIETPFGERESRTVRYDPDSPSIEKNIKVERVQTVVVGRVLSGGHGVPDAEVSVLTPRGEPVDWNTTTDREGRFSFDGVPRLGEFYLQAITAEGTGRTELLRMPDTGRIDGLDIEIAAGRDGSEARSRTVTGSDARLIVKPAEQTADHLRTNGKNVWYGDVRNPLTGQNRLDFEIFPPKVPVRGNFRIAVGVSAISGNERKDLTNRQFSALHLKLLARRKKGEPMTSEISFTAGRGRDEGRWVANNQAVFQSAESINASLLLDLSDGESAFDIVPGAEAFVFVVTVHIGTRNTVSELAGEKLIGYAVLTVRKPATRQEGS